MATVEGFITAHIIDAIGTKATIPVFFQVADTATLADIDSAQGDVLDAIDKIVDGFIYKSTLTITGGGAPNTVKTGPVADSIVEQTVVFNFGQSGSAYKYGIDVPSIADSKLVAGRINFADTDVKAFVDLILAGDSPLTFVSKFAKLLISIIDAITTFRKHRRQLNRETFTEAPSGE